jgi:hypothetical protein
MALWCSTHPVNRSNTGLHGGFELPRESLAAVLALTRVPETEAAVAPDGTLFVAALEAGIVYRVSMPGPTSLRAQFLRPRAGR